jgi:hypothetical protein
VRELLERQPAVDGVLTQQAGGVVTLGIRSADGSLVAQNSRSLG